MPELYPDFDFQDSPERDERYRELQESYDDLYARFQNNSMEIKQAQDIKVGDNAKELLDTLEEIAGRDFRGTGYTMTDIVMLFRAKAREAVTNYKSRTVNGEAK